MTIERAAEILDPESKEKFYGESGKQEVFEAMRLAKLALEKRIKKTVHPFWTGNSRRVRIAQAHSICTTKMGGETDIAVSADRCLIGRTKTAYKL